MNLHDYQQQSWKTAIYPDRGNNIVYPALGLAGEAGEVANKVKKIVRDHGGRLTPEIKEALIGELGDVLWYVAGLATELDVDLDMVAADNLAKLQSRQARGKLGGSGDQR